jgi:hypothetical protein
MHVIHKVALNGLAPVLSMIAGRPRLLLLSTMRSGSTLLTELLLNNPGIVGMGEAHVTYSDRHALHALRYWTLRHRGRLDTGDKLLLDKVLHRKYLPDVPCLQEMVDLVPVVLVRDPATNAASLEKMFSRRQNAAPTDVGKLMRARYDDIEATISAIAPDTPLAAISYEALTSAPETVLPGLGDFLGLNAPLSSDYKVSSRTGRWGVGDGSSNIKTGRIMSATPRAPASASDIGSGTRAHYEGFLGILRERAQFCAL